MICSELIINLELSWVSLFEGVWCIFTSYIALFRVLFNLRDSLISLGFVNFKG